MLNALVERPSPDLVRAGGDEGEKSTQRRDNPRVLLTAWRRLVRWQTQDADGAQVRDQLRQAARLWQERGRSEDLLWSGTAYRDFAALERTLRGWTLGHGRRVCKSRESKTGGTETPGKAARVVAVIAAVGDGGGDHVRSLAAQRGVEAESRGRDAPGRGQQACGDGRARARSLPHRSARVHVEKPRAGRHRGGTAACAPRPTTRAGGARCRHLGGLRTWELSGRNRLQPEQRVGGLGGSSQSGDDCIATARSGWLSAIMSAGDRGLCS